MLVVFIKEGESLMVWQISTHSPQNYFSNMLAEGKRKMKVDLLAFAMTEHFEKSVT